MVRAPDNQGRFDIKRVVGLPGDFLDGNQKKPALGSDEYFVAGDNRGISCDSRHYGPVKASAILGKALRSTPRFET